jgi:hypothetical protein
MLQSHRLSRPPTSRRAAASAAEIASRVGASLLGGWAFVWGFASLGIASLLAAGLSYDDAKTLVYLLAFLVYLVAFCWSFAAASATRVWLVLVGGGSIMTALAWWLTRSPA